METPQKVCSCCGCRFSATTEHFHRDKTRHDGFHPHCKSCRKASAHNHYLSNSAAILEKNSKWKMENPDKVREQVSRWQKANPDRVRAAANRFAHTEHGKAKRSEWRRKRRDLVRGYERTYRQKYPYKVLAKARNYRAKNRTYFRAASSAWRLGVRTSGVVTKQDIAHQYHSQAGKCYWCSIPVGDKYQVDHVIPISRKGKNVPSNIVIACPSCNQRKNNKIPYVEWEPPNPLH